MIALRRYQQQAVTALAEAIEHLTASTDADRLVVFAAPTGSGKTVMLAASLDAAAHHAATLWLTPGKGGLADQTVRALRSHLSSSTLTVERLDPAWLGANPAVEPGTVLVANWESLTHTNSSTGKRINKVTRTGEDRTLADALTATAASGTPLIVVLDESHWGSTAAGTSALLAEIDAIAPAVRIEASATPVKATTPQGRAAGLHVDVFVDLQDVIAEGMLATEICVNVGLQAQLAALSASARAGVTGETLVLDAAWNQLAALTVAYQKMGSPVRPLLLVQIPDGTPGATKLSAIEAHFAALGVTRSNGRLAVWLSGDRTPEVDGIAAFDSPVQVLVFKQAVATGWDCPRAQILVAFREMRSEIFAIQTVGRILRTAERRHYGDPLLDVSYIYANIDAPTGPSPTNPDRPVVVDVALTRTAPQLTLPAAYASRAGTFDDVKPGMFRDCFAAAARTLGLREKLPRATSAADTLATDRTVTVADVLDGDHTITGTGTATVDVAVADHDLLAEFDVFLAAHLGGYRGRARSLPVMRQVIYDWARQHMPTWWTADDTDLILTVQRLLRTPAHAALLAGVIDTAIAAHREQDSTVTARSIVEFDWQLPDSLLVSHETHDQPANPVGYAYADASGVVWRPAASGPELQIEAHLAAQHAAGRVLWWWKNGVGDRRYFSLAYTRPDGSIDSAYPDYIAELTPTTPDRRHLAILEVKAGNDTDPDTTHKAAALAAHAALLRAQGFDVTTGVVVPLGAALAINDGTNYTNPHKAALTTAGSSWMPCVL